MSDQRLEVATSDRKYTVIQDSTGAVRVLRYSDNWLGPGFAGDGMVLTLAQDVQELRERVALLENELYSVTEELKSKTVV